MSAPRGCSGQGPQAWLMTARQLAPTSVLAARLNHDVKNSLAGILAGLQGLEKGVELSPDDQYVVSLLVDEIRGLNRKVQTLLESVRIDATSFHPVAAETLLVGSVESLRDLIDLRGVDVRICGGTESPRLVVDQRAMERALSHLVRNAVEASETGGEVRLGWSVLEAESQERLFPGLKEQVVVIYGEDRGAGLPLNLPLERLFEPLVTNDSSKMGMGLPVARFLVELHGGILLIHSLPAGGTRFEVLMPLADPPACWLDRTKESCALPPCEDQCEGCEARSEQPYAPCWAMKGRSYRKLDGMWPRKCATCSLFRMHQLPLLLASETPGKDENHGGDRSDCR